MSISRRTWVTAGLVVIAVSSQAASATPSPLPSAPPIARKAKVALPPLLREVEAKYTKAETLEALFTQISTISSLDQTKTSSGLIMVKRPDKVRWQTDKPDPNLLVSDGKRVWIYTPPFDEGENGQLIERSASQFQSKLAQALLSGSFSVGKDTKIKATAPSRFELIPRKGTAGTVSKAIIEIDPSEKLIRKVTLEHRGGNRSEITLSNIQLGTPMGEEVFVFSPPPNTDRVRE